MGDDPRDTLPLAPGNTNRIHVRVTIRIALFDRMARPIAEGVAFKLVLGDKTLTGTTDDEGHAVVEYAASPPPKCTISWSAVTADGDGNPLQDVFEYTREVHLDTSDESDDGLRRRLSNMGYAPDATQEACVRAFQAHHGVVPADDPAAGDLAHEPTRTALLGSHRRLDPRRRVAPKYDNPEVETQDEGYSEPESTPG